MLGLSATMNRKDGTSKVFKMFLGKIVYKKERSKDEEVIVRGILYKTNDDEFNETEMDFRGKPAFSTMISKLCTYNRRSEFILTILKDMLQENNKQQIMILAHNKNLLKYLFDAIKHRDLASVGYYIGGMKETALKESETKQVIIATFAMAAEALDIKTLTTLIMATPKTDIEQAVGRILREKHSQPIVVDIIDSHDIFQNQWQKRKKYYKSQNYKIIQINSNQYVPDTSTWSVLYEPTTTSNKSTKSNTISTCTKKNTTLKSHSSNDRSITEDSDDETDKQEDELDERTKGNGVGVCLLKIKKS
jgi:metal-responsive CopG/Arc/MetJ family transcriptional regulator